MKTLILTTGGTIDKVHDTYTESLVMADATLLPGLLSIGRTDHPRIQTLLMKDSLDMTKDDRDLILRAILNASEDNIVLTHGTGTMEITAQFLDGKTNNKTVVLTGAMRPFSLGKSDAGFNIGGALVACQILEKGVYGVMNGRVFPAKDLRKDTKQGRFDC